MSDLDWLLMIWGLVLVVWAIALVVLWRARLAQREAIEALEKVGGALGHAVEMLECIQAPPTVNVYERFIEEVDGLRIGAEQSAVLVVGELTRAVKRAQMVVDGELRPVAER